MNSGTDNTVKITSGIVLFFILLICSTLPVCADEEKDNDLSISVTDMSGKRLKISKYPRRIISLAPSTTEILFSLGIEDRIAAVTDKSNFPPQAKNKPSVGNLYLDYERIVQLQPDLIIVEGTIRPRAAEKLRRLKLPVLVTRSDTFENFKKSTLLIGKVTGTAKKAEFLLNEMRRNLDRITRRIRNVPFRKRPRVFIEIWNRPLMTAGRGTFINHVIERAGGVNLARNLSSYPRISNETLLLWNPDVIILTTSTRSQFIDNPLWENVSAVRSRRVYKVNPDLLVRPTLRLFEGCRDLYNLFYPGTPLTAER